MADFVNLTAENLETEHLCCIIRTKTKHPGVEAKRKWLAERLEEGHVFRKLDVKGTVFIEYAPLEKAWVPVEGENYLYLYCLWVLGEYRGKGYAKELLEYAINDAKAKGNPVFACWGQRSRKLGFPTKILLRNMALCLWIPQKGAMNCWRFLLTELIPILGRRQRRREWKVSI